MGSIPIRCAKFMRVFSWERTQPSKLMERVRIPSPAPVYGAVSSVGRAARLHRVGREFETLIAHQILGLVKWYHSCFGSMRRKFDSCIRDQ